MCDQGKKSGTPLFLGWESDFKEQKYLPFVLVVLPLKTQGLPSPGSKTALSSERRERRHRLRKKRTREIRSRHCVLCGVCSFASLHLTLYHQLIKQQ